MANPNIANVSTIVGNNNQIDGTTAVQAIINNPAGSGKIYKVTSINVSNYAASPADATIRIYSEDDLGGTAFALINAIPIPVATSLVTTDKTTSFYLKEDQSVGVLASVVSTLAFSASWEEIG